MHKPARQRVRCRVTASFRWRNSDRNMTGMANGRRWLLRVENWQLMSRGEVSIGADLKPEMGQQTVDIQRPVMAQSVTVSLDSVV